MTFTKLTDHLKLATDKLVGFKPEPYELNPGYAMATESIYKMVDQFHELFRHPRRAMPEPSLLRLRAKLIHEEAVTEGIPAARNGDMTALLDAMADSCMWASAQWWRLKAAFLPGLAITPRNKA